MSQSGNHTKVDSAERTLYRVAALYDSVANCLHHDAWILLEDSGRVVASSIDSDESPQAYGVDVTEDLPFVMPGLVNAHVHLTDAWREESVPGGEGFPAWGRRLLSERSAADQAEIHQGAADALQEMNLAGTVGVGEVVNDLGTVEPLVQADIASRLIYELIGTRPDASREIFSVAVEQTATLEGTIDYSLAAHTPCSVSVDLIDRIARWSRQCGKPWYIHLAEDPEERKMFVSGEGEWVSFLKELGVWDSGFRPTGSSPIEYFGASDIIDRLMVPVHLTDATPAEISMLADKGVTAILSPRSNLHITGSLPNLPAMIDSGLGIALGTDGRGSSPGTDVVDEARLLYDRFGSPSAGCYLQALTLGGARALRLDGLGAFRPGACPGFIAPEVTNVPGTLQEAETMLMEQST